MTDVGSFDPATMEAEAAEVRAPEAPYVSQQIGCSDLAPLLLADILCRGEADVAAFPEWIRDWLRMASSRSRRWAEASKRVPDDLRGQSAVWCSERARIVRTSVGDIPECVAVKAGKRAKAQREAYMQAGHDLEAELWRRWLEDDERMAVAHYAFEGVPSDLRGEWSAPKVKHPTSPLITYPDGWGETWTGQRVLVNCKTSVRNKDGIDPPAWLQAQGEMVCMRAELAVLPHGIGWAAGPEDAYGMRMDPDPTKRPIKVFWVEADARAQAELVRFAASAMAWILETAKKETAA